MAEEAHDQFEKPFSRARQALPATSRSTSTSKNRRYRRLEPAIGSPSKGGNYRAAAGVQAAHAGGPLVGPIRAVSLRRTRGCTSHRGCLFASCPRIFGTKLWRRPSQSIVAAYGRRTQVRSVASDAWVSQDGSVCVYSIAFIPGLCSLPWCRNHQSFCRSSQCSQL